MIKDTDGMEITYWPISGLIAGDTSQHLTFTVEVPGSNATLSCTEDDRLIVWAKKVGDASFVNLATSPYDLTGLSGDVDFEMYIEALSPIEGLNRIPIIVSAGTSSDAGWTA